MITGGHAYSHKGHNPRFNETHGNLTKCHMSLLFLKPKNKYINIYFQSNIAMLAS